jgi:DNA-binding response OmpR family regulator
LPRLTTQSYQLEEATNGEEGLWQAAIHRPDVIILDLGLPDIDGLEVTKQLRHWTTTPIIVLSARSYEHDKIAALDAGADDYLTKHLIWANCRRACAWPCATLRRSQAHSQIRSFAWANCA